MRIRDDLVGLDAWGFVSPGPLRDDLTALALAGTKTTTSCLYAELLADGEALPVIGAREILLDSDERPVAVIETLDCRVVRLADVDDRHAIDEGEGDADAAEYRVGHTRFWDSYMDQLRDQLGRDFVIDDDTLIVLQRFRVVERLELD